VVKSASRSTVTGICLMTTLQRVRFIFAALPLLLAHPLLLDIEAAQHGLDVMIGWFADPIYLGFYPPYMRQFLGDRLPEFTADEWAVVKGSSDFYGMNTYTTNLCIAGGDDEFKGNAKYTFTRPDGTQLGTQGTSLLLLICVRAELLKNSALCLVTRL